MAYSVGNGRFGLGIFASDPQRGVEGSPCTSVRVEPKGLEMKQFMKGKLIALSLLTMVAGISVAGAPTPVFIADPPTLEPVPGIKGSWGWEDPDVKLGSYDKLLLTDIEIFLAPDSPYKGIDTRQMAAVTATFRAVLTSVLEPEYPLVSQPGQGVAQLSLAITNVQISKRKKNLLQYTPVGLALGGVRQLADALNNISLTDASVEAEFTDSVSGERIGVRVAEEPFAQAGVDESDMSWSALESAFEFYAKKVKEHFDERHGKK